MGSRVLVEPGLVVVLLLDKVEQMDDGGRRHPGNTRRGAELKDTTGCVTGAISTRATPPTMMSSIETYQLGMSETFQV